MVPLSLISSYEYKSAVNQCYAHSLWILLKVLSILTPDSFPLTILQATIRSEIASAQEREAQNASQNGNFRQKSNGIFDK